MIQDMKQTTGNKPNKQQETLNDDKPVNQEQPKRKRGRPKGTTGTKRKEQDMNSNAGSGENRLMIDYSVALSSLPKIDINDPSQVKQRTTDYFSICSQFDIKPSVAALAMAFQVDRVTLFNWLTEKTGTIKNRECFNTLKSAYNQINLLYEVYMNTGKINPVSGIFLMKNNMGYKDTTDYIITPNTQNQVSLSDITNKAGLLED